MDRNEAMKCVMRYLTKNDGVTIDAKVKEALQTLVPELSEGEDEWIRKKLIKIIGYFRSRGIDHQLCEDFLAYLEKQKEPVMKESGLYYYDGEKVTYCGFPPIKENPYDFAKYYKEKKPINWTELNWEDINKLEDFINIVHNEYPNGIGQESFGREVLEKFFEYKEYEYPAEKEQKSAELNEDERIRKELLDYLEDKKEKLDYLCFELGDVKNAPFSEAKQVDDFLAYLERQEESWVPTDEQRLTLGMVIKHSNPDADSTKVLESLLDDLTKIANSKVAKWKENQKEQKPTQFKGGSLAEIIKGEFEGFRSLLKRKGIDYEPQSTYWESFARLFNSSAREYLKGQKPAEWSKEDEKAIERAIDCVRAWEVDYCDGDNTISERLKSLPERLILQPKQEWSEEDEEALNMCLDAIPKKWKTKSGILLAKWLKDNIYLQSKPKWSDGEYGRLFDIEHYLDGTLQLSPDRKIACIDFIKSLRLQPQRKDTYYDIIHNILASLKDVDFMQITPEHRVSLLNDIRVKCKNADECAAILE